MSTNLIDPDVFYVEQSSNDPNLSRPRTPAFLNSTEMSGKDTWEIISISSIASPDPQIVTIYSDSIEPTVPYGSGRQLPIIPPSLNDLNLPTNPFIILAIMALVNPTGDEHEENYSPRYRSYLTSRPFQHHPWTWVPSIVGKIRISQRTAALSLRRTSQDEYTGPLPWMKPSVRKANPDESICCPVHPHPLPLARWKGSWSWECPFQREGECRSTSARPADNN